MQKDTVILANGAEAVFIESKCFNSTSLSFHFYLPLNAKTLAEDSILPYLLTSCCDTYKSYTELNIALLKLYGAELSCSVGKSGDYFHSKIGIRVIDSSFAFDKEDTVLAASQLLLSIIFSPSLQDGAFHKDDVEREKRKTLERIETEINNKRSYARTKHAELMFGDDPFGLFIYGNQEQVKKIDERSMFLAWKRLLKESSISVNVIGKSLPQGFFDKVRKELSNFDRSNISESTFTKPLPEIDEPRTFREEMDIAQGKLVMGFSSRLSGSLDKAMPLMLFADVLGGGPYSRLFENVREKQSLCYYCSALQKRSKGYVIVDSGVEAEDCEKAKAAILAELSALQCGDLEQSRLDASKRSIIDSLNCYYDSIAALDLWYTRDVYCEQLPTPKAAIDRVKEITREDIIEVAKGIRLHTVFELMPKKEEPNCE